MTKNSNEETFVSQRVIYTAHVEGRIILVENVPARVSSRTGERFFHRKPSSSFRASCRKRRSPSA